MQKMSQTSSQTQVMSFALAQALEILQMPQLELAGWLQEEIEKNPLLDYRPGASKKSIDIEYASPVSLYDSLNQQIREHFLDPIDRKIAEKILFLMDERGFLDESFEIDSKKMEEVLKVMQTFDPPGIFAKNLKESLLLQLERKGKKDTPSYKMIEKHYDDLLHARFTKIQKSLNLDHLKGSLSELAKLSMRPASGFSRQAIRPISIDLEFIRVEDGWILELKEDELPSLHLKDEYLNLNIKSPEEKESFQVFKTRARWILRSLNRRKAILKKIGRALLRAQAEFLDRKGDLKALKMKDLAKKLDLHESTLSRALSGKFAMTPRGILSLKSLITTQVEALSAKEMLEKLICSENKRNPLTDQELTKELKTKGFNIARRTVTKYREQLKIGSATQRKYLA